MARNWSEWSPEKPDDNNEIETRTEYRHQDKETTTTRTNANAGWSLDKSVLDGDWNYGAWSGWTRNSISGYTMRHPREKCKRKMYRTLQHVHYITGIITDIIIPMQKHFITPTHLVWVVPGMIGRQIIVCR